MHRMVFGSKKNITVEILDSSDKREVGGFQRPSSQQIKLGDETSSSTMDGANTNIKEETINEVDVKEEPNMQKIEKEMHTHNN